MANSLFATILGNTNHAAVAGHIGAQTPQAGKDPRVAALNQKFKAGQINRNQYLAAIGAVSDAMQGGKQPTYQDFVPNSMKYAQRGAAMAGDTVKFIPQAAVNWTATINNLANRAAGVPQQSVDQQFGNNVITRNITQKSGATGKGKQLAGDIGQVATTIAGGYAGGQLSKKLIELGMKNAIMGKLAQEGAVSQFSKTGLGPKLAQGVVNGFEGGVKTGVNTVVGGVTGAAGNAANAYGSDQPITAETLRNGALTGAAFGAGATIAGPALKVAGKVVKNTAGKVRDVSKIPEAQVVPTHPRDEGLQAAKSVKNARITGVDKSTLSDYADFRAGRLPLQPQHAVTLGNRAKEIESRLGVKLTHGNDRAVDHRVTGFLDGVSKKKASKPSLLKDQGGFVKVPGGSKDLAPDLKPEQKDFINQYANSLKSMDEGVSGPHMRDVAPGEVTRTSDHSAFYSKIYQEKGRAPTQTDYFNEARKQIESGKAMHGLSEDYKQVGQPKPAEVTPTSSVKPQLPETPHVAPATPKPEVKSGLEKIGERPKASNPDHIISRVNDFAHKVYTQTIDRYHPIIRAADQAGKKSGEAMRNALAGHYGAASTASAHIDQELKPILKGLDANDLRTYTIAKRDMELAGRGVKGSDAVAGQAELDKLKAKLGDEKYQKIETQSKKLYDYQKNLVNNYLVKSGVMSKEAAEAMFGKNQHYVPFKRIMDQVDEHLGQLPGKQVGSVSSQDIIKGIKGSDRQIVDPLESIVENTYKIVGLAKRQEVAKNIIDLGKHLPEGLITPLRTAENVKARIDIFSQMKDLKPIQKQFERYLTTRTRWATQLNKELVKLNQEGLHVALKPQEAAQPMRTPGRYIQRDTTGKPQYVGTWNKAQFTGTVKRSLGTEQQLSKTETKQLVNNLVNLPRPELERIKAKIATRENKLGPILDDIADLSNQVKDIKQERMGLRNEASLLKDAEAKGMTTISRFKDGIKEIYQVPKDIAESAKGLNEDQLHTITKIIAPVTRTFRATATGINPEFGPKNVARDLQQAFVVSGVHPVDFAKGFAHYIKKDDVYKQFQKAGGVTSRLSLDPKGVQRDVKDITGKGMKVTNPKQLLKVLEKVGEASEQPTRLALFQKELKRQSKKGMPLEEALQYAARNAQEGTTNFARHGAAMPNVNALYAFLNARMQGTDRLLRSIKTDPLRTIPRLGIMTITPALTLYAYNRNFKEYRDPRIVSDYDKQNNFIIMAPQLGPGRFIKIPKGDVGKLANPLEAFLSFADHDKQKKDVKDALLQALSGFSPGQNVGDLLPTIARPVTEVATNKNFFTGQQIVPDYKKNYPNYKKDTNSTAPIYRAIGKKLNVSPAQIQDIARGYFTGFARIGENATTPGMSKSFKTPQNDQGDPINKELVVRGFVGGAKQSRDEYSTTLAKKINSLNYELNDLKSGINRHDLTQSEFDKQVSKVKGEQQKIKDDAWKYGYGSQLQAALDKIKNDAKQKAADTRKKNGTNADNNPRAYNRSYSNTYNRTYQ